LAFSAFIVVETWLVPVEGWLVDNFGPRPVIAAGAVCAALGWMLDAHAASLPVVYLATAITGVGQGVCTAPA
jgi:OFA family oxalate/formate antiporter-like MFS transporter